MPRHSPHLGSALPTADSTRSRSAVAWCRCATCANRPRYCPAPTTVAASEAGRPLYVVAIGYATNIAAALLLAPEIAARIVVVWDAAYRHHWPWRNRSFNLEQDVPAAQVLFERAQLVYIPSYQVAGQRVAPCSELGALLWQIFPRCQLHQDCSHVMWDIANIAHLIEPCWIPSHVVPSSLLTPDLRWRRQRFRRRDMREVYAVDRDAIFSDVFARPRTGADG